MKMYVRSFVVLVVLFLLTLSVYGQDDDVVTVVTYDSFAISEDVQAAFEAESGYALEIVRVSDVGVMVNQAILTANNPLGDVIYGVDNTFLTRLLDAEVLVEYQPEGLDEIDDVFRLDDDNRAIPVTYGDVCLNYDVAYFEENDLAVPDSLEALTHPDYEGLLVVQNPGTSSPGLAFLLTTIGAFGDEGDYTYLDYWQDLVENDVLIVNGWTEAYYGEFSAGSEDGNRPLVVSYASSPPVEVLFGDPDLEEAPTGAIVADDMCFRQVEFAGILNGTENLEGARMFMNFLLSTTFQEDLPLQMFVFPVNQAAELPELFVEYAAIPDNPVTVPADEIDANRETWIRAWTQNILR